MISKDIKSKRFKPTRKSLFYNHKIEVRMSSIDGYGVFAKEDIKKGEILEECHLIDVNLPRHPYVFMYPKGGNNLGGRHNGESIIVLPSGNGFIYNTSEDYIGANATWITIYGLMTFVSIKDIKKDEEILTNFANFFKYGMHGKKGPKMTQAEADYNVKMDKFAENAIIKQRPIPINHRKFKPKPTKK